MNTANLQRDLSERLNSCLYRVMPRGRIKPPTRSVRVDSCSTRYHYRKFVDTSRVSLCGAVDRLVDSGEEVGGQRTGLGRGDAFGEFAAVLDTQHHGVDGQRQRI